MFSTSFELHTSMAHSSEEAIGGGPGGATVHGDRVTPMECSRATTDPITRNTPRSEDVGT